MSSDPHGPVDPPETAFTPPPDLSLWSRRIQRSLGRVPSDSPAGGPALYAGLLDVESPAQRRQRLAGRRIACAALSDDAVVSHVFAGYASYAEQDVVVWLEGGPRRLRPAAPGVRGEFPFADTAYVLSAWNPGRRATPLARNVGLGERLAQDVAAAGWASAPAAALAPDRSWAERCTLVVGAYETQVVALARSHRIPAVLRWDAAALTVVRTSGRAVMSSTGWTFGPVSRPCPMLREARPGESCVLPAGPCASGSPAAAADWWLHRTLLLTTIGCQTCQDGDSPVEAPGAPVVLGEAGCASRWRGASELGRRPQ